MMNCCLWGLYKIDLLEKNFKKTKNSLKGVIYTLLYKSFIVLNSMQLNGILDTLFIMVDMCHLQFSTTIGRPKNLQSFDRVTLPKDRK